MIDRVLAEAREVQLRPSMMQRQGATRQMPRAELLELIDASSDEQRDTVPIAVRGTDEEVPPIVVRFADAPQPPYVLPEGTGIAVPVPRRNGVAILLALAAASSFAVGLLVGLL